MKNLFIITALLFTSTAYSQDFSNEKNVKFEYYDLSLIPSVYIAKADARIKKIISSKGTSFLYQIAFKDAYSDNMSLSRSLYSYLTKEDIAEAREALNVLLQQSEVDVESKANFIENKYSFENGFSIGYIIGSNFNKKEKILWFFHQDDGIEEATFFVKNINEIVKTFSEATVIIEQLENE